MKLLEWMGLQETKQSPQEHGAYWDRVRGFPQHKLTKLTDQQLLFLAATRLLDAHSGDVPLVVEMRNRIEQWQ